MATVLLVSETKVKAFTTLNQNLDQALLTSCIFIAQEVHLQPVIGTKGYDYYMNLVKSVQLSGGTMSSPDRIMLDDYIAPIVIWGGYYEAIPEIWARKMNKGLQVGSSEQSNAVDIKGMQYYRDNALNKYQFYIQRLLDRVQAYSGDYPWFFSYSNLDGMPSTNQNYFAGITFTPGFRKPPNKNSWYRNLPMYQGPEYDACTNCD
jgi:hypothetical protein